MSDSLFDYANLIRNKPYFRFRTTKYVHYPSEPFAYICSFYSFKKKKHFVQFWILQMMLVWLCREISSFEAFIFFENNYCNLQIFRVEGWGYSWKHNLFLKTTNDFNICSKIRLLVVVENIRNKMVSEVK